MTVLRDMMLLPTLVVLTAGWWSRVGRRPRLLTSALENLGHDDWGVMGQGLDRVSGPLSGVQLLSTCMCSSVKRPRPGVGVELAENLGEVM